MLWSKGGREAGESETYSCFLRFRFKITYSLMKLLRVFLFRACSANFSFDEFLNYEDYLKSLQNSFDETKMVWKDFGKSVEKREIPAFIIPKPQKAEDFEKPGIFIDGGIHANEWASQGQFHWQIS